MEEEYTLVYDYTPLIRMTDLAWPIYFPSIRLENPNTGFPYPCKDFILEGYGYAVIFDAPIPEGDVVTEVTPVQGADGKFYRTYSVRDFTPEEAAADLADRKQRIASSLYSIFIQDSNKGITVSFSGTDYSFSMTTDALNLLQLTRGAAERGADTATYRIILKDGVTPPMNKADTIALINTAFNAWNQVLQSYLTILEQTYDATNKQSLPAVPDTFIN